MDEKGLSADHQLKFRDIFSQLGYFWKLSLTSILVINILVNIGFKWLVIRLAIKNGFKTNPLNWLIIIDELQKFIGVISLSGKHMSYLIVTNF